MDVHLEKVTEIQKRDEDYRLTDSPVSRRKLWINSIIMIIHIRGDPGRKIPTMSQHTTGELGDGSFHTNICFASTQEEDSFPCPMGVRLGHMTSFCNEM